MVHCPVLRSDENNDLPWRIFLAFSDPVIAEHNTISGPFVKDSCQEKELIQQAFVQQ